MSDAIRIAAKGKGIIPMLVRGQDIVSRYGLTPGKLDNSLVAMTGVLRQYDCSATIPMTASTLAANPAIAQKYRLQGIELAVHGLQHVDHSILSLETQISHIHQAGNIFRNLGVPVTGFRCPYLRWNADTLVALSETGFSYDSSQALASDVVQGLETDAYHRVLDFYSAHFDRDYPALPGYSDDLVRIPYCLPDDEALIDRLHITDKDALADIWLAMLDRAYETGELFTLGLHPERAPMCLAALEEVLIKARALSPRVWIARLDEITAWFHAIGSATYEIHHSGDNFYDIKIADPNRATVLIRSVDTNADTKPWKAGYQRVFAKEFTFRSERRPIIGLTTDSPATLQRFLRHQGYLTEVGTDSNAYAIFLDQQSFQPRDERPLLTKLEQGNWPIVRLSRWPDGACCALAVTGDVDALTIWDYAKRLRSSDR